MIKAFPIPQMWVAILYDKISEHSQYQLLHKTTWFHFINATEKFN